MKHLGDITAIHGGKIQPVDVITTGSPCQNLSVAGNGKGLAGSESGLFFEQMRIINEMREATNGEYPKYVVWENVPGALSCSKGADFQAVLTEFVRVCEPKAPVVPMPDKRWPVNGYLFDEMGQWSIAWTVHDAQEWCVPQRRKRLSVVLDTRGTSAPSLLFESESLSGDSEQSKQKGKETAGDVGEGSEGSSGRSVSGVPDSYTLKVRGGVSVDSSGKQAGKGPLIQTDLSATLGVSQDQTLFRESEIDGKLSDALSMDVFHMTTERERVMTLKARDYKDPHVVCSTNIGMEHKLSEL